MTEIPQPIDSPPVPKADNLKGLKREGVLSTAKSLYERLNVASPDALIKSPEQDRQELEYLKRQVRAGRNGRLNIPGHLDIALTGPHADPDKLWVAANILYPKEQAETAYYIIQAAQIASLGGTVEKMDAKTIHRKLLKPESQSVLNRLNSRQILYGENASLKLLNQVLNPVVSEEPVVVEPATEPKFQRKTVQLPKPTTGFLDDEMIKVLESPIPDSLDGSQQRDLRRAKSWCHEALSLLEIVRIRIEGEDISTKVSQIGHSLWLARNALSLSTGVDNQVSAIARQIIDQLKPFRLEVAERDYALYDKEINLYGSCNGIVGAVGVLDDLQDLEDPLIQKFQELITRGREKFYGQVFNCDQLIGLAREYMNIVTTVQRVVDKHWDEAEIILRYARQKKPTVEQVQSIAKLEDMLPKREQVQQEIRKAKEEEENAEIGQIYQIEEQRYTVIRRLGGGKYSEVYLISSPDGNPLAAKIANKDLDKEEQKQYAEEPYTLLRLANYQRAHSLTVNGEILTPEYIKTAKTPSGREFFAMTFATGEALDSLFRSGSQFAEQEITIIGEQLCRVSESLHGIGKGYLDFQPKNIFWDKEKGKITVVDWNLLAPFSVEYLKTDIELIGKIIRRLCGSYFDDSYKGPPELEEQPISVNLKRIINKALSQNDAERYQLVQEFREDLFKLQ